MLRCQKRCSALLEAVSCRPIMKPSEGLSPDRVAYVLSRVNAGLATQWSEIDELAASLEQMLADAHELGQPYIPAVRREEWDRAWRDLHEVFRSLRSLDTEARERFCAVEASAAPLKSWNHILEHEHEFSDHLVAIRAIGAENVAPADQSTWEDLCTAIELRIGTLHAHALTVRFQLELRQKYGIQEADALAREIAERLPKDADIASAAKYAAEYRKAAEEFERDRDTFGGVWDILGALMLIQPKRPEERVRERYVKEHPERPTFIE
jgi:hypothetical protein